MKGDPRIELLPQIEVYKENLKMLTELPLGEYFNDRPTIEILKLIKQIESSRTNLPIYLLVELLLNTSQTDLLTIPWAEFIELCKLKLIPDYEVLKEIKEDYDLAPNPITIKLSYIYDLLFINNSRSKLARVINLINETTPGHNLNTLAALTEKELLSIGGLGPAAIDELRILLKFFGLSFATEQSRIDSQLTYISSLPLRRIFLFHGVKNLQAIANMTKSEFNYLIDPYVVEVATWNQLNLASYNSVRDRVYTQIRNAFIDARIFNTILFSEG